VNLKAVLGIPTNVGLMAEAAWTAELEALAAVVLPHHLVGQSAEPALLLLLALRTRLGCPADERPAAREGRRRLGRRARRDDHRLTRGKVGGAGEGGRARCGEGGAGCLAIVGRWHARTLHHASSSSRTCRGEGHSADGQMEGRGVRLVSE